MRDDVTEIQVREGVTNIPDRAFEYCVNLTSIGLPSTLVSTGDGRGYVSIGDGVCYGCSSLVKIDLRNATSLEDDVLNNCSSLESVDLQNVTSLGYQVFDSCSSLKSIDLPGSLTFVPAKLFKKCTSLVHVDLPLSITSIVTGEFSNCTLLDSISIPSNVNEIKGGAFLNCASLKYVIIPDAAIDNINYGIERYSDPNSDSDSDSAKYEDPFTGCKILEGIAKSFKISVKEYFRASHLEKVKLRAVVLYCLKLINARRMRAREEGKNMKLDVGGGGGGQNVYISDQSFKGVLAESKITAFEMWREILMFV